MALDKAVVLAEIDAVFARCGASPDRPFPPTHPNPPGTFGTQQVRGSASAMVSSCLAAIERNAPHPSYARVARDMTEGGKATSAVVERLLGVLLSVRQDIEQGFVQTLEERTHGAVFDDLLEMAERIRAIHAAPAAVLAGSVLEEHVRKLAQRHGTDLVDSKGRARAFEQLGHDLVRQGVIHEPQRKILSAWYAQRTEAAHGRFDRVVVGEVPRLIAGVREFISRFPA